MAQDLLQVRAVGAGGAPRAVAYPGVGWEGRHRNLRIGSCTLNPARGLRGTPLRACAVRQYDLVARISETHDGSADPIRTRLAAAGAAILTVGAGLGLRSAAAGSVAKYGGDALYTLLLFTLVVLVAPRVTPLTAAAGTLTASWAVEFLQLSEVPAELAQRSTAARFVLGSTFNAPDLFWYVVGAASGWVIHTAMRSFSARREAGTGHG